MVWCHIPVLVASDIWVPQFSRELSEGSLNNLGAKKGIYYKP